MISNKAARLFFFLSYCLLASCWPATGQVPSATQQATTTPPFKIIYHSWNSKDGLPSWKIDAFLHDSRGLMWMNTGRDIFNFDGHTFRQVATVNDDVQPGKIAALAEDLHGNIWIIRFADSFITIDVLRYASSELVPLHVYLAVAQPIRIPLHDESMILHNINGKIWIGSTFEGFLYDGRWQQVVQRTYASAGDYWYPANDGFWIVSGDNSKIILVDADGQLCYTYPMSKPLTWYNVWLDNDLTLWIARHRDKSNAQLEFIHLYAGASSLRSRRTSLPPKIQWYHRELPWWEQNLLQYGLLLSSQNDEVFLGTPQQPDVFNLSKTYPEVAISGNRYIDRNGALWCVSPHTLIRLEFESPTFFQRYLTESAPLHSIRGIVQQRDNLIVNSYSGAKFIHLPSARVSPFTYPDNHLGLGLLADSANIWVGLLSGLIVRHLPNGDQQQIILNPRSSVYHLMKSTAGKLYAGTSNGLYLLDIQAAKQTLISLMGISVYCLHENASGLWAGTNKGLFLLDEEGRLLSAHLRQDDNLAYQYITHIHEEESGDFWLSTQGGGLIHWKVASDAVVQYTSQQGLSNNNIHAVYADERGYFWMPSDYGLMRLHKASGTIHTFFAEDGLADNEFNQMAHFRSQDGRLYLGGINGITSFHPHEIMERSATPYKLHLIEARSFDIRRGIFISQLQNAAKIPQIAIRPTDAYMDIRLSTLRFEEKNQLYYEWKIDGLHDQWIQQPSPLIRLSKLPYGKQKLLVRLRRLGNPVAFASLSVPLQVVRPFYLRLPFILILLGSVIGGAWGLSYWRNRRLLESNLLLEREVQNRTRQIEQDKQLIGQQANELRALDEMKSRFFTNVTHELRSPLTLILGPVDHILTHKTSPEKATDYLRTIQRNTHKLLNLVDELLDLSKMDSNKLVLDETPTLLFPFLKRNLTAFRPFAEQQGIELSLDYQCPADLRIYMDVAKWEKIINNLLSNALKFTSSGDSITLFARMNNDALAIGLADTGSGIAPEDLPHIFDRYFQTKLSKSSLRGGTGIGLSLCREYARLFNADISVQSSPGLGATFTVDFKPKLAQESVESTIAPSLPAVVNFASTNPSSKSHTKAQHTLLLVEDDLEMLTYIADILQSDYHLLTAANGQLALQLLATHAIDLVISDVMMPQMDGFQLLSRSKEIHKDLPFILLTARIATDDRLLALQLGVDDYLTKPFVEEELKARLRNLLARFDTRRAMQTAEFAIADEPNGIKATDATAPFDQKWLQLLDSIILENISDPHFTIADIAEKINTSERNMYYKIKSFTGLTPNQYLIEARLLKARTLLESKAFQTVAEVCFAVGFSSPQYFSRIVKNRFGKSPSDYLRKS